MPIAAGEKITAARLNWDSDLVTLSSDNAAMINTWEQWGSEVITFDNPEVPVKVSAIVLGRAFNNTDATSNPRVRVAISLDGGASYTSGQELTFNAGTGGGAGARIATGGMHQREGTPTGDIVIKAELRTDDLSVTFDSAAIDAKLIPQ